MDKITYKLRSSACGGLLRTAFQRDKLAGTCVICRGCDNDATRMARVHVIAY